MGISELVALDANGSRTTSQTMATTSPATVTGSSISAITPASAPCPRPVNTTCGEVEGMGMEAMVSAVADLPLLVVVGVVEDAAAEEDLVVADLENASLIIAIPTVRCQAPGRRRGQNIGLELRFWTQ